MSSTSEKKKESRIRESEALWIWLMRLKISANIKFLLWDLPPREFLKRWEETEGTSPYTFWARVREYFRNL